MLTRHDARRFLAAAALTIALPLTTELLRAQTQVERAGTVTPVSAQAPDPNVPLYFEVASVKLNNSGERGGMLRRQPGGRMTATNMPLRQLIAFAYQATPLTLVGGPSWPNDERYDIVAKVEGDPPMLGPGA